jgi:ABC-2 type transport system ATP-binding protein
MNIIESAGLGKRYRRTWALRDCTLAVPAGHLVALVGPNGAGKTTLLHMAVGLVSPTAGVVRVLGGQPAGSPPALDGTAFVAQNAPLYPNLPVAAMLHVARNLNRQWDQPRAEARLAELGIPLDRKAGKLSGGQQAQLALTVALARRPRLLVLDEPLAALDPVARSDFMTAVLAAVAGDGISVVLSSHMLAELDRVADYLIVLSHGRLQLAGQVADLLAGHRVLTGPATEPPHFAERQRLVHAHRPGGQAQLLVMTTAAASPGPPGWQQRPASLEEIALGYLRAAGDPVPPAAGPSPAALAAGAQS